MHNNMPLTKEHQMMLGEGEVKPTPSNPRGFSKKQITVLNFFRDRLSVHQVYTGGESGEEQVGIFTSEGCQFFPLSISREALKIGSCRRVRIHSMDWRKGKFMSMLLLDPRNSNQLTTQGGWRYTPCGNKICLSLRDKFSM